MNFDNNKQLVAVLNYLKADLELKKFSYYDSF